MANKSQLTIDDIISDRKLDESPNLSLIEYTDPQRLEEGLIDGNEEKAPSFTNKTPAETVHIPNASFESCLSRESPQGSRK